MDFDKLETEARAKIFWGDSPESVIAYLQTQGATPEEAKSITDSMQRERLESIKASGVKKMIGGGLLIAVPVAAYFFFVSLGRVPLKLFGITIAVGAFGLWKFMDGTLNVFSPHLHRGGLGEVDQED